MIVLLALASVLGFAPPPSSDGDTRFADVRIDTSEVGEAGPVIARRIRERSDVVLRDRGILPARSDEDPTFVIRVREYTEGAPGFEFELVLYDAGAAVHSETVSCSLCTETELVTRVEDRLAERADRLDDPVEPQPTEPAPPQTQPEPVPPPEPVASTPSPAPDRRLQPLGKAGIGLLVPGIVATGIGIGLVVAPDRPVSSDPTREIYTQPPGYALLGIGLASTITGAVLLGLDRRRAKRSPTTRAALTRTTIGLVLQGEF